MVGEQRDMEQEEMDGRKTIGRTEMPQDGERHLEDAWHVVHAAETCPLIQVLVIGFVLTVTAVDERRYHAEETPVEGFSRSREPRAKRRADRTPGSGQ